MYWLESTIIIYLTQFVRDWVCGIACTVATLSPVMAWPMAIIRFCCCVATAELAELVGHFSFSLYLAMRAQAAFSWLG